MDVQNRNNCELHSFGETIPQFQDYMNEIKFPRCILDEEVRRYSFYWNFYRPHDNKFVNSISTFDEQMVRSCYSAHLSY
jgi:exonuclease I